MPKLAQSLLLSFAVSSLCFATQPNAEEQPVRSPATDLSERKRVIHRELDRNIEAVKRVFEMIDHTPESDLNARDLFDRQIQLFDDRSAVLHDELSEIEEAESFLEKEAALRQEATDLTQRARQLKKLGHIVPAATLDAKAKKIKASLQDGSWRLLVNKTSSTPEPSLATVLKINADVETLKAESTELRSEIQQLHAKIKQLENSIERLTTKHD